MAAATHPGRVRSHNEDAIAIDAPCGLAVLADGMGGYNAGEVASRIAVSLVSANLKAAVMQRRVPPEETEAEALIAEHIAAANAAVYEAARTNAEYSGMGTTLVVALWYDDRLAVGHVGDSRLYCVREGSLKQLTRDHSLVREQIDSGAMSPEEARYSSQRNVVTRAVGIDAQVAAEVRTYPRAADDLYLLCSDGLTDMLTDAQIERSLTAGGQELQRAADALVQYANASGGRDNISVILARTASGSSDGIQ